MVFTSTKVAVEGVTMIPDCNVIWGHMHLLRDPDFQNVLSIFAETYIDENGRCCFWMGPTLPGLTVTSMNDVDYVLKQSSYRSILPTMKLQTDILFGKNTLFVLNGREWKTQRSIIHKALHNAAMSPSTQIENATKVLVESIDKRNNSSCSDNKSNIYQLHELMKMLTIDIFGQTAMHIDFGCCMELQQSQIVTSFEFLTTDYIYRLGPGILNPISYLHKVLPITKQNREWAYHYNYLHNFITNIITKRREDMKNDSDNKNDKKDLLTRLLLASDENTLSDEAINDAVFGLLFAGYETTAVSLTYAIYLIATHKDVYAKCIEEIKQLQNEDSPNYVYLDAVLTEAMRLYPPAISTTRSLEKDIIIDGINIPKGTYMYVPIWSIHRSERNFDKPLEFIPDRWLDGGTANNKKAFVTFSAGARSCPGQKFAMVEMIHALRTLLSNLHFEVAECNYILKPHRTNSLVQSPEGDIPMKIVKRKL